MRSKIEKIMEFMKKGVLVSDPENGFYSYLVKTDNCKIIYVEIEEIDSIFCNQIYISRNRYRSKTGADDTFRLMYSSAKQKRTSPWYEPYDSSVDGYGPKPLGFPYYVNRTFHVANTDPEFVDLKLILELAKVNLEWANAYIQSNGL